MLSGIKLCVVCDKPGLPRLRESETSVRVSKVNPPFYGACITDACQDAFDSDAGEANRLDADRLVLGGSFRYFHYTRLFDRRFLLVGRQALFFLTPSLV